MNRAKNMGHSSPRTGEDMTFMAQVIIQHYRAVQPHTAVPRLARVVKFDSSFM